jgi:opacity protein-like surface antigen
MCNRQFLKLILAGLFLSATTSTFSQVAPGATEGGVPLVVGGGISDFDLDWGPGRRMEGISAWVDWDFDRLPGLLRGLGIEAEGHDINWNRPSSIVKMRQDTGLGGITYHWRHYRNLRPYVKMMGGIGSIDFPPFKPDSTYTHDTFTVFGPGGGVEYRAWRQVWVRGEYEYQAWHHTFGSNDLTPQGFTIGASYHFSHSRGQ